MLVLLCWCDITVCSYLPEARENLLHNYRKHYQIMDGLGHFYVFNGETEWSRGVAMPFQVIGLLSLFSMPYL